jgi:RimJ/RimL family protein N-acetyltransferase
MLTLLELEVRHKEELLSYSLSEEQSKFTAVPKRVFERIGLRNAQGDFDAHPICILYEGKAVGMFVLDRGSDLSLWTERETAVFVRSLSINPQFQGKGLGKQAMRLIPKFAQQLFAPRPIDEIVLGVNRKNEVAISLYKKLGYRALGFNMNPPFVGQIIMKLNF